MCIDLLLTLPVGCCCVWSHQSPFSLLLRLWDRGRAFYTPHERREEADMTETGLHCDTSYCARLKDEIEEWKSTALQGGLAKVRSVSYSYTMLPCVLCARSAASLPLCVFFSVVCRSYLWLVSRDSDMWSVRVCCGLNLRGSSCVGPAAAASAAAFASVFMALRGVFCSCRLCCSLTGVSARLLQK